MNILITEDDRKIAKSLKLLLESEGYKVTLCKSCQETYEKSAEKYDLMIIDITLPDGDGFELFERNIVELDFEHRNIIIHSVLPDKASSYKAYDLHRVPEDQKFSMLPRVIFEGFVKKDGTKTDAWLLVDLGSITAVWYKDFRMQLTTDSLKQDTTSQAYDYLLKTHQLNDYYIPITDDYNVKEDGTLGVDYLSQHSVIFDYLHDKLYLKPNGK